MKYAGVGSRETPLSVLDEMIALAAYLARQGWLLRSGGADGADTAFEHGCGLCVGPEAVKEIFLPWRGFNGNESLLYTPSPAAAEIAATIHPAWDFVGAAARALHARNVHQVLGLNLDDPVDCVICWTKVTRGGKVKGGTATAINLARSRGIPVFNMYEGFYFRGEDNYD